MNLDVRLGDVADDFLRRPPSPLIFDLDGLRTSRDDARMTRRSYLEGIQHLPVRIVEQQLPTGADEFPETFWFKSCVVLGYEAFPRRRRRPVVLGASASGSGSGSGLLASARFVAMFSALGV